MNGAVSFPVEMEAMARQLSKMKGNPVRKSLVRAINATMTATRQKVVEGTARKEKIKQPAVRKKIRFNGKRGDTATYKNVSAKLNVFQRPIPVISLVQNKGKINLKKVAGQNAKSTRGRARLGGTQVKIAGGSRFYQRAFISRVKATGQPHIFQRHGKERYKIRVVSISIKDTMNKLTPQELKRAERDVLQKVLKREYIYRWNQLVK
jgi:hypothetical protein